MTDSKRNSFLAAVHPLMLWLKFNCHPHTTVIVDSELVELVEGVTTIHSNELPINSLTAAHQRSTEIAEPCDIEVFIKPRQK